MSMVLRFNPPLYIRSQQLFVAPQSHFSFSSPAIPSHMSELHSIFWTNLVPLVPLNDSYKWDHDISSVDSRPSKRITNLHLIFLTPGHPRLIDQSESLQDNLSTHQASDTLYNHIFSCIKDLSTVLKILGFLFFSFNGTSKPITTIFLSHLLGLDEEDVYLRLWGLHSILYIPPPKTSELGIRTTHASVQDFLVDKLRSGKHYLDEEA